MANPWSNEHGKDRARERKRVENDGDADAHANTEAKERLRASGGVRAPAQAPNDRAYGPQGER